MRGKPDLEAYSMIFLPFFSKKKLFDADVTIKVIKYSRTFSGEWKP